MTARPVRIAAAGVAAAAAAVTAALFAAPTASAAGTATAPASHRAEVDAGGAVFAQSDNTTANTVVAYHRAADGTLDQQAVYPTGGRGGVLDGSVVDHLASQGSLAYDRAAGLLYAVNAGSDTLTVFAVHGDRLERTQVVPTSGSFPVSVTYHDNRVWVLNALGGGSIQGYVRLGDKLVRVAAWHRALGLDPQAAPQFTHTPGQISFTPDGGKLVVTTKAGANTVDVFSLGLLGTPAAAPVVTSLPDAVPFAFSFDPAGRLQLAEAGPNAVETFVLHPDGTLASLGRTATGQAATCWITGTGDKLYVSNAGSANLSAFRARPDAAPVPLGTTATDPGTVDAAVSSDGRTLYAQTGGQGTVDEFAVHTDGSLTRIGSVTVPGAIGGEGIAAG
ncbi:lactonase family protein [Actinacidiphila acididurans]|uniref:Beta-propeller fold lactonase family protein n=1 Tax=Actinacidiphila acididurans TaxID=2784346 RepID=A0ABS2U0G4_9ACTN|nr:beta-propeller fold lactonase family protein [Actinacidiphila acididurans]MBM9509087.1 beta-propeller fold lactonase family protein [Actinacidiphila acididurans]